MKVHPLLLGSLGAASVVTLAAPARAGQLVFWRFEAEQNLLVFRTDAGLRPRAQLVEGPTRVVVDLPGTRLSGGPLVSQPVGGAVREVRAGQFDVQTARLVVELAPGYTLDPQQISIQPTNSTQWLVRLPQPQRETLTAAPSDIPIPLAVGGQTRSASLTPVVDRTPLPPLIPSDRPVTQSSVAAAPAPPPDRTPLPPTIPRNRPVAPSPIAATPTAPSPSDRTPLPPLIPRNRPPVPVPAERSQATTVPENAPNPTNAFAVTRNGLVLNLVGGAVEDIDVDRSRDDRQITIDFRSATLPPELRAQRLPVERYGISYAEFDATDRGGRITLHVDPDTPDWNAIPSSSGSLVLLPKGGMAAVQGIATPPVPANVREAAAPQLATIQSVELDSNRQIRVRADRAIDATESWDPRTGVLRLTIPQAQLSRQLQGPQLSSTGPIARVRVQQEGENAIVQVEARPGVNLQLAQAPANNLIALNINSLRDIALPPRSQQPQATARYINIPAAWQTGGSYPRGVSPGAPIPRGSMLVVIDPGHGGRDPGAIGIGGLREKDIVIEISHHVRRILESEGISIRMTRQDDRFISLGGRSQLANRARANLFVSIHANAISMSRPDVNGLETFYYSTGRRLAQAIQSSMVQRFNMRNRGVKQANFHVLRHSSMPAVLVEVGFVTGREDAPRLADSNFRRAMAEAIAEGVLRYVRQNR
ncbi:N-acetylmuramoyl-L-alanine amidase [Rubidibacter lacunae KORDI 51-2]|uniref:N-acetylmuramoyl-L-alanine amidase n=1 Tax=Rubidibacter lacunae KORDI 51-2 TaxID=582515 RepID=U5D7G3_9CHRO|nr:N-acetylmuramoyl-L-alanine amidase [Rubidibacter lacunae KORDI 51-2]